MTRVKEFVKKAHRSLSEIVESYLNRVTIGEEKSEDDELVLIYGMMKLNPDFDEKKAIREILNNRYSG